MSSETRLGVDSATRVPVADLSRFCEQLFVASGGDPAEAPLFAQNLVWNEQVGRNTQGVWRMPVYLKRLEQGIAASPGRFRWEELSPTMHRLDAGDGLGQVAGTSAMRRAVELAQREGIGTVGVRGSNHFGTGAYFVQLAAEAGQLGIALSNSFPKVAPFGGRSPVFGTNPFAFAAPRADGRSVLVDFATSASSGSAIRRSGVQGGEVEEGVAIDKQGNSIRDARQATDAVLTSGGPKGFAMMLFVEIVSAVLTGAGVSGEVASLYNDFSRPQRMGHFFLAIDVSRWMPVSEFHARLESLVRLIKEADRLDGVGEILIPGETRWRHFDEAERLGIPLDERTLQAVSPVAERLGVRVPWEVPTS